MIGCSSSGSDVTLSFYDITSVKPKLALFIHLFLLKKLFTLLAKIEVREQPRRADGESFAPSVSVWFEKLAAPRGPRSSPVFFVARLRQ